MNVGPYLSRHIAFNGIEKTVLVSENRKERTLAPAESATLQQGRAFGILPVFVETTRSVSFGLSIGVSPRATTCSIQDCYFFPSSSYFDARNRFTTGEIRRML